eukprot:239815_1
MMYSLEKRLKNMEQLLQQNIPANSQTKILNNMHKELKQLNAHNIELNDVEKRLNARNINSHPMQCEKIINRINKIDNKMDEFQSNQIKLNKCHENQINVMEQIQRDSDEIQKTLILNMRDIQSVKSKMNNFTYVKQSIQSMESHLLSLKKNKLNNNMIQNTSTSLQHSHNITRNQTDAPSPKQILSLKNNKHDTSPQIFSNNLSDIRNNNTSNKSTSACIPLESIDKYKSLHSEITSLQETIENTFQNSTQSLNTKSTYHTSKSIPTYNTSSKSIPKDASIKYTTPLQSISACNNNKSSDRTSTIPQTPQTFPISCENVANNNNNNNNNILSENIINDSCESFPTSSPPSKPTVTSP